MRTVWVMTCDNKIQGEWEIEHMKECLQEITANGYTAYDIRFDFNGDIIIYVCDTLSYRG